MTEVSTTAERAMVTTRVFDAPRELVFKAWTDPELIPRWWGPRGFTTTVHEMDVRVGGLWRLTMHGPDGVDYPNRSVYVDVRPPERLAYTHFADEEGTRVHFEMTATFEERDGKTHLTMEMLFPSAAEREEAAKFGAVEGAQQTLDRLAELLAQT